MATAYWVGLILFIVAAGYFLLGRIRKRRGRHSQLDLQSARQLFHLKREWLEAHFMTLASHSGKPRGLTWVDCDFSDGVHFARDRHSRQLRALVGLTIRFEAVEGGDMEDNPNVKNLRAATAVFRMDRDQWITDGLAVFNLSPEQTIRHFQHELEELDVLAK